MSKPSPDLFDLHDIELCLAFALMRMELPGGAVPADAKELLKGPVVWYM